MVCFMGFGKCKVFKLNIVATTMKEAVYMVCDNKDALAGKYITFSNVHTTVMAADCDKYAKVQNCAEYIFADGAPIAWYQKLHGFSNAERIAGPDFLKEILDISEEKGYRHFFYGSSDDVLNSLEKELHIEYPNLQMEYLSAPYGKNLFNRCDKDIKTINDFNPDFVWIGLGAPKQEVWMYKNRKKINAPMLGVGAAFDYYAKTTKRAPKWIQKMGFEWFYRLLTEPKRLFGRYFYSNLRFFFLWIQLLYFK